MSVLKNFKSNIPPKARFTIALLVFMTFVFGFIFIKVLSDDEKTDLEKAIPPSKVANAPSSKQIQASKPGDKVILPEGSPLSEEIDANRKAQIEESKKSGGGFMDQLNFDNSMAIIEKNQADETGKTVDGLQDADPYSDTRNEVLAERARMNDEQNKRAQQSMTGEQRAKVDKSVSAKNAEIDKLVSDIVQDADKGSEIASFIQSNLVSARSASQYKDYATQAEQAADGSVDEGSIESKVVASKSKSMPSISDYLSDTNRAKKALPAPAENVAPVKTAYEDLVSPMGVNEVPTKTTINVGEMYYGVLQIGVNTDEIGPVRVYVPGGNKIPGAVLVGQPVRVGEKAMIQLTNLSVNGKDHGVDAVVLNPETLRPGLADNVDRHTFERYFKLSLAAAADGYVDALQGSSRVRYGDGSEETIRERLPDSSDQAAVAVGRIGEVLIPKFERDFDTPPTVSVDSNRDVIIMFMSTVEI